MIFTKRNEYAPKLIKKNLVGPQIKEKDISSSLHPNILSDRNGRAR